MPRAARAGDRVNLCGMETGDETIIRTDLGEVRGIRERGVHCFRALPYARPPLGARRWRPPEPVTGWKGIRECRRFAPSAIQPEPRRGSLFPQGPGERGEDCLYLNIWTPAPDPGARLPVIVHLHLGGFQAGSAASPLADGRHWAERGAVYVSVGYRLGRLGFLPLPELAAESDEGMAGNYGLMDQLAALEWINAHIASFGGNPDCVTLFGLSSGATAISLLMTIPRARRLFHRAIAESGGSFGPLGASSGIGDRWQHREGALASGRAWAASLGDPGLPALRQMPATALCVPWSPTGRRDKGLLDAARPVIDGHFLREASRDTFAAGRVSPIPLLVGSAGNEGLVTVNQPPDRAAFLALARDEMGDRLDDFLRLYPATRDAGASAAGRRANGHRLFSWQSWTWARLHAAAGHPVFYYRFEMAPPVPVARDVRSSSGAPPGAFHGASLFYLADLFGHRPDWHWSEEDRAMRTALTDCWIAFARTGRPSLASGPAWPRFDSDRPLTMRIGAQAELAAVPEADYLAFWDGYYGASG